MYHCVLWRLRVKFQDSVSSLHRLAQGLKSTHLSWLLVPLPTVISPTPQILNTQLALYSNSGDLVSEAHSSPGFPILCVIFVETRVGLGSSFMLWEPVMGERGQSCELLSARQGQRHSQMGPAVSSQGLPDLRKLHPLPTLSAHTSGDALREGLLP